MIAGMLEVRSLSRTGVVSFHENPFLAWFIDGKLFFLPNVDVFRRLLNPDRYPYLYWDTDYMGVGVNNWINFSPTAQAEINIEGREISRQLCSDVQGLAWLALRKELDMNVEKSLMYFILKQYAHHN